MAELSKNHGIEIFQTSDKEHLIDMNIMKELMNDPEAMSEWYNSKKKELNNLPENS